MAVDVSTPKTRTRLLEAAAELFAEKGFNGTTVRDICHRAEANVAAVNYHFKNKRQLYDAVIRTAIEFALHSFPLNPPRRIQPTPEERLYHFVLAFLRRRLDKNRPDWQRRLLMREMANPGPGTRSLVAEIVERNHDLLLGIVREILHQHHATANDRQLHLVMASIVGQCLFFQPGHFALQSIHRHLDLSQRGLPGIARHITDFSLAAIRGLHS
ncbi:MAG: CerR family C-terminal domain-containing protein [Acidobacteria bacterium]|nr:CerR family C-terminal domain-containing protein [Acidobacteriota bacterium]